MSCVAILHLQYLLLYINTRIPVNNSQNVVDVFSLLLFTDHLRVNYMFSKVFVYEKQ